MEITVWSPYGGVSSPGAGRRGVGALTPSCVGGSELNSFIGEGAIMADRDGERESEEGSVWAG